MKERDFIEDLEALSRQYWGKDAKIILNQNGVQISYPRQSDLVDLQAMVKQITGQL